MSLNRLEEILDEQCKKWDVNLLEFEGDPDHIHLMLEMHPNILPSNLMHL